LLYYESENRTLHGEDRQIVGIGNIGLEKNNR